MPYILNDSTDYGLKNAVDEVASHSSASTKDGSISQLATKLLAILCHLIIALLLMALLGRLPLSNSHGRHRRVVWVLLWGRSLVLAGVAILRLSILWLSVRHRSRRSLGLAVLDKDVVAGEDALLSGALVLAHPPVLIHVLVDGDPVVLLQRDIAGVGAGVAVEGAGVGNDGLGCARWRAGRWGVFVGGRWCGLARHGEVLHRLYRW